MRCSACSGNKKVMKLGMVMGECGVCKGTGLEKTPEPLVTIDKDVKDDGKKEEAREVKASESKATSNNTKRKK